jgi:hypothetical protein
MKASGQREKCIWFWEMIVSRAWNVTNSFVCFSPQIFALNLETNTVSRLMSIGLVIKRQYQTIII